MKRLTVLSLLIIICAPIISGCTQGYVIHDQEVTYHGWNEGYGKFNYVVNGADVRSFKVIDDIYAKDKNQAYAYGSRLIGSDPDSFGVFMTEIAYDKNRCYYGDEYTHANHPKDIRSEYIKTNDTVVYRIWRDDGTPYDQIIPNADAASFKALSYGYSEDKNNVYFASYGVTKLKYDVATFTIVNPCFIKDKNSAK
jgi:hypothetical protein